MLDQLHTKLVGTVTRLSASNSLDSLVFRLNYYKVSSNERLELLGLIVLCRMIHKKRILAEKIFNKFLVRIKKMFACSRLQENLVESKHHKLARSVRSGMSDKDAKPNASMRDMLNAIVSYPPTKQLSNEEQDLVWKFRFYLSNQKKALTKFLKCVNWSLTGQFCVQIFCIIFKKILIVFFFLNQRKLVKL